MRNALSIVLVAAAAAPAWAKDLQVGQGKQYAKIGDAVAAAEPGDRIVVSPGIYDENVKTSTNGLTLVGTKSVIWDGTAAYQADGPCLDATGDNIVVQGFRLRAGTIQVQIEGRNARVRNCTFEAAQNTAVRVVGENARVEGCSVRGAYNRGIDVEGAKALVSRNRLVGVDGPAVTVNGAGGVATGNNVLGTDSGAIVLTGDDCSAQSNTVGTAGGEGIRVEGARPVIRSNRVSNVSGDAVSARGDGALVEKNSVLGLDSAGVFVVGDSITVTGNRVAQVVNDSDGFSLSSNTPDGGGRVEKNTVYDGVEIGFAIYTSNVRYTANKAYRCGTESDAGFHVGGRGNTLTACVATDGEYAGFELEGFDNTLVRCTAVGNQADGFRASGRGNAFNDCAATGNGRHGFVNRATDTSLVRGKFLGNGQDVSRTDSATWAVFDKPKFKTGGKDELSLYSD